MRLRISTGFPASRSSGSRTSWYPVPLALDNHPEGNVVGMSAPNRTHTLDTPTSTRRSFHESSSNDSTAANGDTSGRYRPARPWISPRWRCSAWRDHHTAFSRGCLGVFILRLPVATTSARGLCVPDGRQPHAVTSMRYLDAFNASAEQLMSPLGSRT
jgi:hypothetical protein